MTDATRHVESSRSAAPNSLIMPDDEAPLARTTGRHSIPTSPITTVPVDLGVIQPRRRLGVADLRVFPVALSGKVFGWTADEQQTFDVLDTYFAQGGNFVDTADSYANGLSESLIGAWMKSRITRDDIVLATKVGKSEENPGLTPRSIERAVDASLRRLGTDRIDLLYLHVDDTEVAFERTLLGVDRLIRAGKVRYFGGSDHSGNRLYEARIAAGMLGVAPMVALQNEYSLVHRREYEEGLAKVAQQQRLAVMPRFALASGFLSGRYRTRSDIRGYRRGSEVARLLSKKNLRILAELDRIASLHASPVAAVALAWLLTKPNVVAPVVSATSPHQVTELAEAARVQLTRHEVAELDRVSA
ncbi:aldo/keto reductase [Frondihabitans australicus]|uniref:Aryl-alcohol dehydrogenase-like predicted oxidoreductase n=1 Tax=Frondihabitans australicus TaxID=386892 RepID=A0A495IES3_9MICO|nr:aldo/keto reductase [Frondihabitans australicus]RKR74504.1 aryl-alcohol dehydrogenase-like predicted oxidoreductase [Frondihabitans australicus]